MDRTIYEYFNCRDNEELYLLIKNNDKRVSELKKFLKSLEEYKDKSIDDLYKFTGSTDCIEFFKEEIFPNENEMVIVGLNVVASVVSTYRYSPLKEIKTTAEVLKELNTKGLYSFIPLTDCKGYNEICEKEFAKIKSDFTNLGFIKLDDLKVYENYISNMNFVTHNYWDYEISKKALNSKGKKYEKINEITKLKEYDNFIKYYVDKEIIGLEYNKDKEKIYNNLKKAYEHLGYEKLGFIKLDEDLKVLEIKEYSSGDINCSTVPKNRIIKEFAEDKATNYIMYHNHPSNTLKPSEEDKIITKEFNIINTLGKNLIDSVIVSKEGYISLKDSKEYNIDILGENYISALKVIDTKNKSLPSISNNKKQEQAKKKVKKKSKGLSL